MKLLALITGSKFRKPVETVGVGGVAYAGQIPHLNAAGQLDGTMTMVFSGAGAPVDGTTGDNVAPKGSAYIDTTNANWYIQTGLITNPVYKLVTRAA